MHPMILGAGLIGSALFAVASLAACPPSTAAVEEHFVAADCPECWAAPGATAARRLPPVWRFDWITPRSADAPLAIASLAEAKERANRATGPAGASEASQLLRRPAGPALAGVRLSVASGPAWQGYFGLQFSLRRGAVAPWPAGTTAWLALVELVPAGSDDSAQPRALVRSVAGPLPIGAAQPGRPFTHLQALRWPPTAQPTRLQARAWLETPDGTILAVAADRCP